MIISVYYAVSGLVVMIHSNNIINEQSSVMSTNIFYEPSTLFTELNSG